MSRTRSVRRVLPAQHNVDALMQQRLAARVAFVEHLALRHRDGVERRRAVVCVKGQRAQRHARQRRTRYREAAQRAAARTLPHQQRAVCRRARLRRELRDRNAGDRRLSRCQRLSAVRRYRLLAGSCRCRLRCRRQQRRLFGGRAGRLDNGD